MARGVRAVALVVALGSLLGTASCSGSGSGTTDAEKSSTSDGIVWQQTDSFGRLASAAGDPPSVTIYGDGRIYVIDDVRDERRARVGSVAHRDLRAFLAKAADSGLFAHDVDLGDPGPLETTTILSARVDGELRTSIVISPGIEATNLRGGQRITPEQAARRKEILDLAHEARALAYGLTAWTPERMRAVATVPAPGEEIVDEELISELLPEPWPGPPFRSFPDPASGSGESCLVVTGDEAGAVFRADNHNLDVFWRDGDQIWQIDTIPLVPGVTGCPPD